MDRLEELLVRAEPKWHVREVLSVLIHEDWGEGSYPLHTDLQSVGQILDAGADALAIRFREVDPEIWAWLIEEIRKA